MRVQQDGALKALGVFTQGLERDVAAHGMTGQHGFLHAAFVEDTHDHGGTERQGVDAASVGTRRRRIGEAVSGHVDNDDPALAFQRLHQFIVDIHRLQIAVQQHDARLLRRLFVFRVPHVDSDAR